MAGPSSGSTACATNRRQTGSASTASSSHSCPLPRAGDPPPATPGERPRPSGSRAYLALVGAVSLVIVLLIIGLLSGHGSPSTSSGHTTKGSRAAHRPTSTPGHRLAARRHGTSTPAARKPEALTLALTPSAPVWVCLIGEHGEELIPGEILQPGTTVEHHAAKRRFEIKIGNTALQMKVDGKEMDLGVNDEAAG